MRFNFKFSTFATLLFLAFVAFASCEKDVIVPTEPPNDGNTEMPSDTSGCDSLTLEVVPDGDALYPAYDDVSFPDASYEWSTGSTEESIAVTQSGTYTLTITTADGCTATASYEYTASSNEEDCDALTLEVAADGHSLYSVYDRENFTIVAYDWSTGSTSEVLEVTESGIYTLTITTADSCTATASYEYTASSNEEDCDALTLEVGADGDVLFAIYDRSNFDIVAYEWSTGETAENILVTQSGIYTLTITTADGCTATASFEYTDPSGEGGEEDCDALTLEVGADGNALYSIYDRENFTIVAYEWSTGSTSEVLEVTESGVYTLTITTADGCTATASYEYTAPSNEEDCDALTLTISLEDIDVGADLLYPRYDRDNFDIVAYEWSTGSTSDFLEVTESGTYTLTITTADGCTATTSYEYTAN